MMAGCPGEGKQQSFTAPPGDTGGGGSAFKDCASNLNQFELLVGDFVVVVFWGGMFPHVKTLCHSPPPRLLPAL